MQTRAFLATSLLVACIAGISAAGAANNADTTKGSTSAPSQRPMPDRDHHGADMQRRGMGPGMMGGGMMGMMNGCSRMMSEADGTPHLPPGNERLQLKMQAEIMQKTAEILSRYADQIGDGK